MSVDALSLACNVITVIDFGHKFYATFRDVYDNGASDPTTEYKANELAALAERLKTSRNRALQSVSNNDQLLRVAEKCVKAAEDLQNEIRKLTPSGSASRTTKALRSLLSAGKRTWRHNRIEQLIKSLGECRATMQTAVLLHMYESGEADRAMRLDEFSKLDSRLQTFIHAVSKQDLQISQLLAENRMLHQETRAIFRQEVTAWKDAQISDGQLSQLKASLRFPEMNQRYNELRTAHEKSFQWLLGDSGATYSSDPEHSDRTNSGIEEEPRYIRELRNDTFGDFEQWLTSDTDSKLYWMSGKPGAGKSTFMKNLFVHMENEYLLEGQGMVIRHFFWLGASDTRSRLNDMEGMFMTLLYQLLNQEVSGKSVAAMLLRNNTHLKNNESLTDWSFEELKLSTKEALSIVSRQGVVYILIDGLDEIREFEQMANVRLILSSRRERIFDKRLALSRQLRLHTLTGPDIYHFSLDSLLRLADFQEGPSSEFAQCLAAEIVYGAEGVFLWARLAVKNLKRGFIDGNSDNEIRDRLFDMPIELTDYFKSIWKRLGNDQKRYQAFAANIFSLLVCSTSDYVFSLPDIISDFNLMSTSLAQNIDDARLIIHGETHIEETYLLKLCQETERRILSHCAGLVEVYPHGCPNCNSNCAPKYIDLTISTKKIYFVHRTAREFFQETPEWKQFINFNDMATDGPIFRFALGILARLAAFRDLRQSTFHRCALLGLCTFREILNFLGRLETASAISTKQRHSLLALTHILYFRFSDHPDNSIFHNWKLTNHYHSIYPFVILAATYGHGEYAMQYLEMQTRSGRTFPIDTYAMVLKASLDSYLKPRPRRPWKGDTGRLSSESLEKLIHHFQASHFPSTIYYRRLVASPTSDDNRTSFSVCHMVLNMLFDMSFRDDVLWADSTSDTDKVVNTAVNLAKLLGISDTGLFEPILCTIATFEKGWRLWIPTIRILGFEHALPAPREKMSVVFEVSPIWLIRHMARLAACKQGPETFCGGLMDLVDLHCQSSREIRRPRPVLLLGSWVSVRLLATTYLPCIGVKEIPTEIQGGLSEILIGLLEEDSGSRHGALVQRLRDIWTDTSLECLRGIESEELCISRGLWCSEEEEKKTREACNILGADDNALREERKDSRYIIPPDGCSEWEERLSYHLIDEEPRMY